MPQPLRPTQAVLAQPRLVVRRTANGERREADVARGQRQVGEDEGEVVAVGLNRRLVKRDTHLADPADSLVLSSSRVSFRGGDPHDAYHLVLWAADVPPSERHERTCEWAALA